MLKKVIYVVFAGLVATAAAGSALADLPAWVHDVVCPIGWPEFSPLPPGLDFGQINLTNSLI
jgi:hypothetical protein